MEYYYDPSSGQMAAEAAEAVRGLAAAEELAVAARRLREAEVAAPAVLFGVWWVAYESGTCGYVV